MAFLLPFLFSLCLLELCFGLLPILPTLFLQPWECRSTSHSNKGSEQQGECAERLGKHCSVVVVSMFV